MGKKWTIIIISVVAIAMSAFHLYTSGFGRFPALQQRSIHMAFGLILTFLIYPFWKKKKDTSKIYLLDLFLIIAGIASCANIALNVYYHAYERAGQATTMDIWLGAILIILIIEMTRRIMGWTLPIITLVFIAYAFLGPHIPVPFFAHRGMDLSYFISYQYVSTNGIWSTPVAVSATFVAIFVIFASFLTKSGVGNFFMNASQAVAGGMTGGPAKVAVVSSAAMGSISGSAVGNVVTTGSVTIPLMKKMGFPAALAGAIEATASTGGQIMPPVMGAAAFIIASIVGVPYLKVCVACAFPAILYFFSALCQVHFEAKKLSLSGLPRDQLPRLWPVVKKEGHLLLPLVILIYLLITGSTAMKAGFYAVVAVVAVSAIQKSTRMNIDSVFQAMEDGAKAMLVILCACASSGIIIGVLTATGMALKIASLLITVSHGSVIIMLILAMCACVLLGMGVTTTAAYLLVAILISPALVRMGIPILPAHIFVFYFAVVSTITPPVCLAAYAAAGIAESDPFKTGLTAWRVGIAGFVVPFFLIYRPEITLLMGHPWQIVTGLIITAFGVFFLDSAATGYLFGRLKLYERLVLSACVLLLIRPGLIINIASVLIILFIAFLNWSRVRRNLKERRKEV